MRGSWLFRASAVVGGLLIAGAIFAAMAVGNCGGAGENASIQATPASLTFNVGDTKSVTVDNTGSVYVNIEHETLPGAGGATFQFTGGTCLGLLAPGASCSRSINCIKKGEDTYSVEGESLSAPIKLKCD